MRQLFALWFGVLLGLSFSGVSAGALQSTETQVIVDRYLETLLTKQKSANTPTAIKHAQNLLPEGIWADIEYEHDQHGHWAAAQHLIRIRVMALARYDGGLSDEQRVELTLASQLAIKAWYEKSSTGEIPSPKNNYWKVTGAPRLARDIFVLLRRHLERTSLDQLLGTMGDAGLRYTGTNLIWQADIVMHRAAIRGDTAELSKAVRRMESALVLQPKIKEGIKPDWSFHQHGQRLQSFAYGKDFLNDVTRLAWQLRGTRWEFGQGQVDVLVNFAVHGLQWMSRGSMTVPSTLDRACSRRNSLQVDLHQTLLWLREIAPSRQAELDRYIANHTGTGQTLVGFRFFNYSDFTAYHRPEFSFFLKTVSQRTRLSEAINGENVAGGFMNWGDHYLVAAGDEYHNLQPVWDWTKLPGLTAQEKFGPRKYIKRQAFAGAVTDGSSGLTAFVGKLSGKGGAKQIDFHKSWFCHQDLVIGLVSGLQVKGAKEGLIQTAVEQCRLVGDCQIANQDQRPRNLEHGEHQIEGLRWLHHRNVAYFPIGDVEAHVSLGPKVGSWKRVNRRDTSEKVEIDVFTMTIQHREAETLGGFGYAIIPGVTPAETARIEQKKSWNVVCKDDRCHAVAFDDEIWMATFFDAGSFTLPNRQVVSADAPCLMFYDGRRLQISNPTAAAIDVTTKVGHMVHTFRHLLAGQKRTQPR